MDSIERDCFARTYSQLRTELPCSVLSHATMVVAGLQMLVLQLRDAVDRLRRRLAMTGSEPGSAGASADETFPRLHLGNSHDGSNEVVKS